MSFSPGVIIQARRGSSRLPDKVVRPFYNDLSILEILIARFIDRHEFKLVIATTTEPEDDLIYEICKKRGVPCYRGSATNVLERFYDASLHYSIDPIIRVCSDNPFILPFSPVELLESFLHRPADYIGYRLSGERIGIRTHFGLWAELLTLESVAATIKKTDNDAYLEHVTSYLYEHKNEFNTYFIDAPDIIFSREDIRLTVDTWSDFELAKTIYNDYCQEFDKIQLDKLVYLIDEKSAWKTEMLKSISENEK